ncbi:MAG: hybrid sensor histidine kinase/response regulator [Vicinamibacteraceae bacterium]
MVDDEQGAARLINQLQQRNFDLETELRHYRLLERTLRSALTERDRNEQQLREFFENAAEGLHLVGQDGVILWANRAELDLLGYPRDEYVGHYIAEFYADEEAATDILNRLSRNEIVRDHEVRLRCKDGSIRYVLITANGLWEDAALVHARCFTRDITDRKQAHEARAWLAAIVDSSNDAIIGKTLDGIITSWNTAAERIFQYTAAEAIGQHISVIIPTERRTEEDDVLARLRRGEKVGHFETVRCAKDGRAIDISLTVSPIRDADGRIIGASNVSRDITDQKRAELELHQASQMKDEFLATLSHELRTPLNAVLGWSQVLRSGVLPPDIQQRALDSLERNARAQAQLVEDLLDVSRVISGKLKIRAEPVDLARVISAAVDTVGPSAAAKRLEVHLSCDAETELLVTGDADRLQQVVWNLLSNAVKFTPAGGRVDIDLARRASQAEITVRDTGRGIDSAFLPHVFERFRQADSTAARAHGGLGLGLALVRHVVEAHGGTVGVDSGGEGRGAAFTVRLPVRALTESRAQSAAAMADRSSSPRTDARVLVVDDEPDARELLRVLLESHGAQVMAVGSAGEALHALQSHAFDLLLADIGMPEQDGYSLISAVRSLPAERGGQMPAVAVTAYVGMRERERALNAGYDWHLAKPVDGDQLIAIVVRMTDDRMPPTARLTPSPRRS